MPLDSSYSIVVDKKFHKYIEKNLPQQLKKVFDRKLGYLSENPSHPSLNTNPYNVSNKTLKYLGVDAVYEFYINRGFRCIFYVIRAKKQIILAFVGNHEDVKRRF